MKSCTLITGLVVLLLTPLPGLTQRSLETRYGHVVAKREIKADSNVAKGAIIGAIVGLVTASGKSDKTKIKRVAGGAVLGGVIANQIDKSKRHWQYTIRFPGGEETHLAVQEDYLNLGDCAAVHYDVEQTFVDYASGYFCSPEASREAITRSHGMEPGSDEPQWEEHEHYGEQQREERERYGEQQREERKRHNEQRREDQKRAREQRRELDKCLKEAQRERKADKERECYQRFGS